MDDSDFTTTGTGTVTLASAANLNDVVNIVSFESNIPDNDYVPASGGTFTGAVTASNGLTVDDSAATPLTVDRSGAVGSIIDVQKDGSTVGQVSNIGNDFVVGSSTGSGAGLRFDGTNNMMYASNSLGSSRDDAVSLGGSSVRFKDLYLSGGVYLGGTGATNKLDDYEYGTFTPSYSTTNNDQSGVTYTASNAGTYVKVGNVVHFQLTLSINAMTSNGTGVPKIGGLPFNTSSSAPLNKGTRYTFSTYSVDYMTSSTAGYMLHAYFPTNGVNYLHFLLTQDGYSWGVLNTSQFTLGAGHYVTFQGVYFAD